MHRMVVKHEMLVLGKAFAAVKGRGKTESSPGGRGRGGVVQAEKVVNLGRFLPCVDGSGGWNSWNGAES